MMLGSARCATYVGIIAIPRVLDVYKIICFNKVLYEIVFNVGLQILLIILVADKALS